MDEPSKWNCSVVLFCSELTRLQTRMTNHKNIPHRQTIIRCLLHFRGIIAINYHLLGEYILKVLSLYLRGNNGFIGWALSWDVSVAIITRLLGSHSNEPTEPFRDCMHRDHLIDSREEFCSEDSKMNTKNRDDGSTLMWTIIFMLFILIIVNHVVYGYRWILI